VIVETNERDVVVSSGATDGVPARPIVLLHNGRYYSELYLDGSWLEGGALNETGQTVLSLARSRMAKG
jgi:hypothetical protein